MNALMDELKEGFTCLGFFSNQFGHQTNEKNKEIVNTLAHVRPGKGFKCKFPIFAKCDVNGANEAPLFTFLKGKLPMPVGAGAMQIMKKKGSILWEPVKRSDIAWNFEKVIVNKEGIPVARWSKSTPVDDKLKKEIEALLK
uniref:Glutathione peroxidase n=1 Tax=Lotharella globosa TaxID=91324 RepID=A0A7S3Z832_9EUKA|mmetsp:Transcript_35244/g.68165  ORF Transcript_35244/g.68165 Transcript_35244/m.68165 type:complete len:141 (+) Transcript_35244:216-638(+)|eukprot:CAMPEP_0167774366 /NCGR_PEP_ID=MMETSP0111_2-20121227/1958_1 /TAXON_ID=91324 /ORGANISM="Lotharella globosa, Strain CCCM811" /LENGTH=140 /DNA_ID=CAMNT_0007664151 /DNA_START=181 /DNA_END=603 /DNA_ORIENTATION=-